MQVILVKPVRKLGKVGEIVNVANGYGRNYLIPQELAIRASKDNVADFEAMKKDLEAKNATRKSEAEKAAKAVEGKHLTFVTQSAADGRLFGSVSAKALAVEIAKIAGVNLDYHNVILAHPIKFNGVYEVELVLHAEVVTSILVVVAKSDAEAADALIEFKEGGKNKEEAEREEELAAMAEAKAAEAEATPEDSE
ncbi:50S ribosomal protein L9 [Rickettsiaceae bacterium]|nr:50S ribosomal protein L9 [Rickettsiaceae bacterium]